MYFLKMTTVYYIDRDLKSDLNGYKIFLFPMNAREEINTNRTRIKSEATCIEGTSEMKTFKYIVQYFVHT